MSHGRRPAEKENARAEGVGFEPTMTVTSHSGFQDRRTRPLCEPSGGTSVWQRHKPALPYALHLTLQVRCREGGCGARRCPRLIGRMAGRLGWPGHRGAMRADPLQSGVVVDDQQVVGEVETAPGLQGDVRHLHRWPGEIPAAVGQHDFVVPVTTFVWSTPVSTSRPALRFGQERRSGRLLGAGGTHRLRLAGQRPRGRGNRPSDDRLGAGEVMSRAHEEGWH